MTVEHRTGDLLAMDDLAAIGHGVNCVGKMGSGIAVAFRNTYADMHSEYVRLCKKGRLTPGLVFPWRDGESNKWILNIASQYYTGADARMDALLAGVEKSLKFCEVNGLDSLGLPQIGCGIGGLEWDEVRPELERLGEASRVKLVLVTYGA